MRTKKQILIALFLCTWTIVSYYLLIRQTDSNVNSKRQAAIGLADGRHHRDDLHWKLNRLETNIQEESIMHDELVKELIKILRSKKGQNEKTNRNHTISNVNHVNKQIFDASNVNVNDPNNVNNENNAFNTDLESTNSDATLENHLKWLNKRKHDFKGPIIPVLVFACNRISVRNCLDDLVKYQPNSYQFPIIVSQVSRVKY